MDEPRWLIEARQKRAEAKKVREAMPRPEGEAWHRGAIIEALTRLGQTSATISGEHYEGDAFFVRICTNDLRSLLEDRWFLAAMAGDPIVETPPDVPDVPEPVIKATSCRCNCGYTCGGPGRCDLPLQKCIDEHFVVDCDHDWTGEWVEDEDGLGGSVTCKHCGMARLGHDMVCGP